MSDASPALATEKLTGIVPAAAVSMANGDRDVIGEIGCCGLHAITVRGGGGSSPEQVQPPDSSTHANTITNGTRTCNAIDAE
ncbi:MAG: hypothetical protein L6Q76_09725 [Polyangiaceae bacterium]|nr:hypothetical protein [Polyangiaceae bacterium]